MDMGRLFSWDWSGRSGVCGVETCTREWVQVALIVGVCVAEGLNAKWEGGVIDRWIERLVVEERKKMEGERMEEGVKEEEYKDEKEKVIEVVDEKVERE